MERSLDVLSQLNICSILVVFGFFFVFLFFLKGNNKIKNKSKNISIDEVHHINFKEKMISVNYYNQKILIFVSPNHSLVLSRTENEN